MAEKRQPPAPPSPRVDDLVYRYSQLNESERRQFDRKYAAFRGVRRQFAGLFDRISANRPLAAPASAEKPK
jgi:hypothetical protein